MRAVPLLKLSEMIPGQEADAFVLLSAKEELTAKNGKPYFKVTFRDGSREMTFPIWSDSSWAAECRAAWTPGVFYKLRAVMRETSFGPQLEIRKIREVVPADAADGFDPQICLPHSRFNPEAMFQELLTIARQRLQPPPLCRLVEALLQNHRAEWLAWPAARHNHHAFVGGLLEHTLSVTRTCIYLADKYAEYYPEMQPPLDKSLTIAGAILHDVGKLREYDRRPEETTLSAEGALLGHMLLGRDLIRDAARDCPLDAEILLRLEHAVIAHQRLPEWGAPKPPMTPEALLIHYADDCDAKFHMMVRILREDNNPGPITSKKNILMQHVFRGRD
jgi:3'-5' exoribonuclease